MAKDFKAGIKTNALQLTGGTPTAGKVWTSGDSVGNGSWQTPSGGSGSGDVVGGTSSVNNEVALYEGAGGKTIKSAGANGMTIDPASGNVIIKGNLTLPSQLQFDSSVYTQFQALAANLNFKALLNDKLITFTVSDRDVIVASYSNVQINQPLQITAGSPGSGKVLTSDGSGNASWQTASGGASPSYDYYHQTGTSPERWYQAGRVNALAGSTLALTNNVIYAVPFVISKALTLDRLGIRVTTAATSGTGRMAIYTNTSDSNLYPSTLIVDGGQISTSTAAVVTTTINQTLQPGLYWMCINTGVAAPTVTALSVGSVSDVLGVANSLNAAANTHMTVSSTFGAFPSTFPGGAVSATAVVPMIAFRASA